MIRQAISTVVEDIQSIRRQLKPMLLKDTPHELLTDIIFGLEAMEQMVLFDETIYPTRKQ